ncbi:unnamed protein product [Brassicogethes aeneus]|uniref:Uncharacterized protein n=1 Tax=Brassicogethes aeneus TaxID=1431903 RepID=A0A9P0AP65_BRAAE|nr:unnamed protein product [Brassicogethes aeneus]
MKCLISIFIALVCVIQIEAVPLKLLENSLEVQNIIGNVPEEDRKAFYKDQIFKGYELRSKMQFDVPKEITLKIYDYFLKNRKVENLTTIHNIRDTICFPNGDCIDTDDPGVRPFIS